MQKKYTSKAEAWVKIQRFCAYQDRCHSEVRSKLLDMGVYGDTLEELMADLVTERFLDEERFARSFAGGKFRIKHWGRVRIRQELKRRRVSDYCIRMGLSEISDDDYQTTLTTLLEKQYAAHLPQSDAFTAKQKAAQYALRRGFESELVFEGIRKL